VGLFRDRIGVSAARWQLRLSLTIAALQMRTLRCGGTPSRPGCCAAAVAPYPRRLFCTFARGMGRFVKKPIETCIFNGFDAVF